MFSKYKPFENGVKKNCHFFPIKTDCTSLDDVIEKCAHCNHRPAPVILEGLWL